MFNIFLVEFNFFYGFQHYHSVLCSYFSELSSFLRFIRLCAIRVIDPIREDRYKKKLFFVSVREAAKKLLFMYIM